MLKFRPFDTEGLSLWPCQPERLKVLLARLATDPRLYSYIAVNYLQKNVSIEQWQHDSVVKKINREVYANMLRHLWPFHVNNEG